MVNTGNNGSDAGPSSYRDGYSDCAREVATYLGRLDSPGGVLVRTRVLAHLSARLRAVNSAHRRQQAAPTASRPLPVPVSAVGEELCRVTTSFRPVAASSSTREGRLGEPPATSTCLADDSGNSDWLDAAAGAVQRSTTPPDDKHHVTTTTVTSPTYDVNGNDVTTRRASPFAAEDDDDRDSCSLVWRPW